MNKHLVSFRAQLNCRLQSEVVFTGWVNLRSCRFGFFTCMRPIRSVDASTIIWGMKIRLQVYLDFQLCPILLNMFFHPVIRDMRIQFFLLVRQSTTRPTLWGVVPSLALVDWDLEHPCRQTSKFIIYQSSFSDHGL